MGMIIYISATIVVLMVGFVVAMRTMISFNKKYYSKNS